MSICFYNNDISQKRKYVTSDNNYSFCGDQIIDPVINYIGRGNDEY